MYSVPHTIYLIWKCIRYKYNKFVRKPFLIFSVNKGLYFLYYLLVRQDFQFGWYIILAKPYTKISWNVENVCWPDALMYQILTVSLSQRYCL